MPGDSSLIEVVYRNLNGYVVTGQNSDKILSQLSRNMCGHDVAVGKLNLEDCVGQCLNDSAFKFDYVVLRHNFSPFIFSVELTQAEP